MKHYLTVQDVAQRYQVAVKTVYNWVTQGQIPSVKVGGARRFIEAELKEWELSNIRPTQKPKNDKQKD